MTYADRVKDTTTSVGTGTITLSNVAPTGYQTFAAGLPASSTVPYCISSQSTAEWEVGNGVLLTSTTLSRSPTASSNAGGLVNFSAGTKDVFCTLPSANLAKLASATDAITSTVIDASTSRILIEEGGVTKRITMNDFLTALGTSSGGLPAAATLTGTNIINISQDGGASQVRTTLTTLATFLGAAPVETIGVNTPTAQTAGTAFSVSGTYTTVTPSALDVSVDGGTTYTAATATISGGTFSFSLTLASANASQVIKVRDRTNTTIIGTSGAFSVAAAAGEVISVTTPSAKTAGTAFTLAGTYSNVTPASLDYSLDGGTTWVAATATIASGAYNFSLTITAANASQVVKVRDRTNTTIIGTSAAFAVAAASAPVYVLDYTTPAAGLPANGNISINGNYPSGSAVNVRLPSGGAAAPGVSFAWSKSTTVQPVPGTTPPNASAYTTATRLGWAAGDTPGGGYYGLWSYDPSPYIFGTAGNYYLWVITSDGFADVVRDAGVPHALVLT